MDLSHSHGSAENDASERRFVYRRSFLATGAALLGTIAMGGIAWGTIRYAFDSQSDAWKKPSINILADGANLFKPGDRPHSDITATCFLVNTAIAAGRSRAYWGTDLGLEFHGDDQRDWPLRAHAFGNNAFSYAEYSANEWYDRWSDTISKANLSNNSGGCGRSGYGGHHLVSFSGWDTSAFGGVIPSVVGAWSLHNVSGITWGTYGLYLCGDYQGGIRPPDSACATENMTATARVTCYSYETIQSGTDITLRYLLYFFFDTAKPSVDVHGGINYASALAAGIQCDVDSSGLGDVASVLIDNVNRNFAHESIDDESIQELVTQVETGAISVPQAVEESLKGVSAHQWYKTPSDMATALSESLLPQDQITLDENSIRDYVSTHGFAAAARYLLEQEEALGSLTFPLAYGSSTCDIEEADVTGETHNITIDTSGSGKTGRVYHYGTYSTQLSSLPPGWKVDGESSKSVLIPDNGSGKWFPVTFSVVPQAYPSTIERRITVTFRRDAQACASLGQDSVCHEENASIDVVYEPSARANASGVRPGCTSWDGWYTDEACTIRYSAQKLTDDLTLYCRNEASILWQPTTDARSLEKRFTLFTDESLSVETTLEELLPTKDVLPWGSRYSAPSLPTIWVQEGYGPRISRGSTYRDAAATTPFRDEVAILRDTTFFGHWSIRAYDGVIAS